MQEVNHKKFLRKRGRPKKSALSARDQARGRKIRQRARLARNNISKIEVFLPSALKSAVRKAADGKSYSEVGEEAIRIWLESRRK